jgi:hypothetical protein
MLVMLCFHEAIMATLYKMLLHLGQGTKNVEDASILSLNKKLGSLKPFSNSGFTFIWTLHFIWTYPLSFLYITMVGGREKYDKSLMWYVCRF